MNRGWAIGAAIGGILAVMLVIVLNIHFPWTTLIGFIFGFSGATIGQTYWENHVRT